MKCGRLAVCGAGAVNLWHSGCIYLQHTEKSLNVTISEWIKGAIMKGHLLNRFKNFSTVFKTVINLRSSMDLKSLNDFITDLYSRRDIDDILARTAHYLQNVLDIQVAGFVLTGGEMPEVWAAPHVEMDTLRYVFDRELGTSGPIHQHLINTGAGHAPLYLCDKNHEVLSYRTLDQNYNAKLCLVPSLRPLPHHGEILKAVLKTFWGALTNCLKIQRLEIEAAMDQLTRCYNRRAFERLIHHNIDHANRGDKSLSLIIFDIDHFKKINDNFGHQAGDEVLSEVAAICKKLVRKGDYVARYGGEEFVVVLPETKMAKALVVAERVRKGVERLLINTACSRHINVTASFGVSTLKSGMGLDKLVGDADRLMYRAKDHGRNMVMPRLKLCNDSAGEFSI